MFIEWNEMCSLSIKALL